MHIGSVVSGKCCFLGVSLSLLDSFCLFCVDPWALRRRGLLKISQLGRSAWVPHSLHTAQGCVSHHLLQEEASLIRVEQCSDRSHNWYGSCLIQGLFIGVLEIRAKITTRHDLTLAAQASHLLPFVGSLRRLACTFGLMFSQL